MAGHPAVEAHYQPLKNSASFKRHKSLPHPAADLERFTSPDLPNDYGQGSASIKSSHTVRRVNGMSMPGAFPINGYDSGLPPTPPRHSHDASQKLSFSPNLPHQNGLNHRIHKRSNRNMPANARSPPTPDTTPPATSSLVVPLRPAFPNTSPSSRTDSFRTAREEQWSSDDESHIDRSFQGAVKTAQTEDQDLGLGLEFERDDDSSTPTPRKIRHGIIRKESPRIQMNRSVLHHAETIPDREWDTELMRNVTVRRKKRAAVPRNKLEEDEQRIVARDIVPKLVNGSSEDDEMSEPSTPNQHQFSQIVALPRFQNHDEQSKRLSSSSHTSTVLEAFVFATPPRRQMTLRHVSKNLSLRSRSDGSSPAGLSSRASSVRTELSDEPSMRRMGYGDGSIFHEDRSQIRGISPIEEKSIMPTISLKHHPERRSLRLDAESWSNASGGRRVSEGTQSSTTTSSHQRTFSGGDLLGLPSKYSTETTLGKRSEAANLKYDTVVKRPMERAATTGRRGNSPTRAATRRALQRLDSTASTASDIRPSSYPRDAQRSTPVTHSMVQTTDHIVETAAAPAPEPEQPASVKTTTSELVKSTTKDTVEQSRPLEKRSTIESIPRVSFDRSTVATHELHRASNASSTLRPDSEHAAARHLYAQTTPFSQTSDLHEMGEATAVSIYPHNNNSLLVVQQVARPAGVQRPEFEVSAIPGWPTLTIQPATPPQQLSTPAIANVDSPLKNPRRPPQPPQQGSLVPPIITILPATPEHEIETLELHETAVIRNSHPPMTAPTRSLSLVQRARRYSDTVMRPIITRTSSMRRSYYRRPRSPRQGAPKAKQPENTLHPFWQPRGFWDDFSDSESDFGDQEGDARLPPGGDTSDVGEPRGIAKVFDGLRTSKGFLIGNSLGLERSGTNKRKPVISLPVGLGRRTSGRVVRRTSQGTLRSIGTSSRVSPPPAKTTKVVRSVKSRKSIETLRRMQGPDGKRAVWNPKNWQVHYVGVSGMRDMWKEKQAEKRRAKLKNSIGVRYSVEGAPTRN